MYREAIVPLTTMETWVSEKCQRWYVQYVVCNRLLGPPPVRSFRRTPGSPRAATVRAHHHRKYVGGGADGRECGRSDCAECLSFRIDDGSGKRGKGRPDGRRLDHWYEPRSILSRATLILSTGSVTVILMYPFADSPKPDPGVTMTPRSIIFWVNSLSSIPQLNQT